MSCLSRIIIPLRRLRQQAILPPPGQILVVDASLGALEIGIYIIMALYAAHLCPGARSNDFQGRLYVLPYYAYLRTHKRKYTPQLCLNNGHPPPVPHFQQYSVSIQ